MHDVRPFLKPPFEEPGTLLYVGYRPDAHAWLDELLAAGNQITVLEVWPSNLENVDPRVKAVCGDVRDMDGEWDHVWWWHGPEHVLQADFPKVLESVRARRLFAVAAPWGRYDQGAHAGNPHERHLWSVRQADLEALGFEVRTDGKENELGSEIVGWKCE